MVLDTERDVEKTILIVEDDAATGELLYLFLSEETPHRAILVSDAFQALKVIKDVTPNLFLVDYRLPKQATATPLHCRSVLLLSASSQQE